jgi:hypothetical protein
VQWLENLQRKGSAFCNHLSPIPNLTTCPSSPAAREPISVAIAFDHLRKKGAMVQKANVSPCQDKEGQDGEKERVTLHSSVMVVALKKLFVVRFQCRWKEKK